MEALLAGDAEAAAHLASALAADAQCGAVAVGDVDRFDVAFSFDGEEVFLCPVGRGLAVGGRREACLGNVVQACADFEREVGHRIKIAYALLIHPVAQLFGCEFLEALLKAEGLKFVERKSKKCGHI